MSFFKQLFSVLLIFSGFTINAQSPCTGGLVDGTYPCNGLTMQSYISAATMGSIEAQDSWGWTDVDGNGDEYAIVALNDGTAFVNITDPINPVYLGRMDSYTGSSYWRDVKVYNNHAYIVSDSNGNHGVQIFDLKRLRGLNGTPAQNFNKNGDGRYGGISYAHNVIINEDTGYLYILGSNRNSGAPRIMDLSNPTSLSIAGNVSSSYGYCHDAQVLIYNGPDTEHVGKELLIGSFSGSDFVKVLDVTNKSNITEIGSVTYLDKYYTHQGWFTEDQRFFIVGDEVDEINVGFNTRTLVFDMQDLDNPVLHYTYYGPSSAIDHNGYVKGNRFYLANYSAGMRILKIDGLYENPPSMTEVDFFDSFPGNNNAGFDGIWNVYPFFESGNLIASGFGGEHTDGDGGLFILRDPNFDDVDPVASCQNITATLNASGTVTITGLQVDGGSTDNIGITKRSLDIDTFTCEDIGPNTVTLIVEDDYGNKSSCTAIVTVQSATTTYTGTWSNGTPNAGSKAIFSSNYNTASGSIETCECEIESSSTVTVNSGEYLKVDNNILVDGNLFVAHEGSVVQTYDSATTINNGSITVRKTTPSLTPQGFMILGSPMTSETREGVYGSGRRVLNHITGNFVPNPLVELLTPGSANWADDNGDNWGIHTGLVNPAEGYFVRPQPDQSTGGSFDLDYTLGTLNTGVINYSVLFNNNQNDSPNILSNPFASAIDAEMFFDVPENAMINEMYFWNHITPPLSTYPGYQSSNFNMGDISVYVEGSGGIAAANGGDIPNQFIASGQGFGVKPTSAGTAVFNNSMRVTGPNDTYRNTDTNRQRIWLDVSNETYKLGANTLVAFMDSATDSFEDYDSKRIATPVSIYSVIDSGEELGIQGRSAFNENQIVQLGFSSMIEEEQLFSISIRQLEGEDLSATIVYLYDKMLEITTNLSDEDYLFTSNAGNFNERFELSFKERSILGTSEALENIAVYPNPSQNLIHIDANDVNVNSVAIFDLRGRQVGLYNFVIGETIQINISAFETSMYFIEINSDVGTITKRILKK